MCVNIQVYSTDSSKRIIILNNKNVILVLGTYFPCVAANMPSKYVYIYI